MPWFVWALICPFCWTISNMVDSYMAQDYFAGRTTSYVVMTGLSSIPFLLGFWAVHPAVLLIEPMQIAFILLSSLLYIITLYPYMAAMQRDDVSVVVPILQIVPMFVFVLGIILLGEDLKAAMILPCLTILAAAVGISWSFKHGRFRVTTLAYTLTAAFLFACNTIILRYWTHHVPPLTLAFWQMSGWVACGLGVLPFLKQTRHHVMALLVQTKGRIYGWSLIQDSLDMVATICFIMALSTAPRAGLVPLIGSIHPAIAFVTGGVLAYAYPRLFERFRLDYQTGLKILAILVMIAGYIWLYQRDPQLFDALQG